MALRLAFSLIALVLSAPSSAWPQCTEANGMLEPQIARALSALDTRDHSQSSECTECSHNGVLPQQALMPAGLQESANAVLPAGSEQELQRCVSSAVRGVDVGKYLTCPSAKSKGTIQTSPPCASEALVRYTTRSFSDAMKCIGVEATELFPLFNTESRFSMTAISATGCSGIGQLSGIAIRAMNQSLGVPNSSDPVRRAAPLKDKLSSCPSDIRDRLQPYSTEARRCERVGLPNNPLMNFVYGGLLYKHNRDRAMEAVLWCRAKAKTKITDELAASIAQQTAFYAYNGGLGTVLPVLKRYCLEHRNQAVDAARFHTEFKSTLRRSEVREETVQFVTRALKNLEDVKNRNGGQSCGKL